MNKTLQQLVEQYASCPESQSEYDINGKQYIITRHFTGDKNINKAVAELAVSRANRETGLL